MTAALSFERVRITTLRSTYWLAGLALALNAVVVGLFSWFTRDDEVGADLATEVLTGFSGISPLPFTAVFMAVVGILAAGHEYRYGTIQPTLTAVPRRGHLMVAKIVVVSLTSILVVVLSLALSWALAALLRGEALPFDSSLIEDVLAYVALTTGWALLGVGLAFLLRGVPSALVILFVTPLIVEPLLAGLSNIPALDWLGDVVPYLPFSAGQRMLGTSLFGEASLSRWESGAVFGGFVALILAAAWALFRRRDA